MKRLLAMLLAGCMLVQPLPGSSVTAFGAETEAAGAFEAGEDQMAGGPAEDMTSLDMGVIEEIASDDPEAAPDAPVGDPAQNTVGSAAAAEGNGDEILDTIDVVSLSGEDISGNGAEVSAEEEGISLTLGSAELSGDPGIAEASLVRGETSSYIEVKVVAGQMFVPKDGLEVTVSVLKADDTLAGRETRILGEQGDTQTLEFGVDPGEYRVQVTADRYARYEQTVRAGASQRSKICVSTARSAETDGSKAAGGWLRLGDTSGDGEISQADIDMIRDVILGKNVDPDAAAAANLNEGLESRESVDIADLQIAIQNKNKKAQTSSVEVQQIPLPPETEAGTKIEGGSLSDLIKGGSSQNVVSLQPEGNKEISEENPVAVSFPLAAEGEEPPMLGGMTIQAPVDTADMGENGKEEKKSGIESGWLEVESVENGKPVIYLVAMTKDTDLDKALEAKPSAGMEKTTEASAETEKATEISAETGTPVIPLETEAETETETETETAAQEEETEAAAAPVVINLEDLVLGGTAEMSLDGTDVTSVSDMPEVDLENETSVPGLEDAVSGDEEVILIAEDPIPQGETPVEPERKKLENSSASVAKDGSIVMNFGGQIAVKKVTIKITGTTKKEENLVNISKVEFVNDMEQRIPEPVLNIPELTLTQGNEEILVTWKEETNVTGYELWISGEVKKKTGVQEQTVRVAGTKHTFTEINNNSLRNFRPYQIKARSVNGEWRSSWSEVQTVVPKPDARPEPVDNLKIKAGFRSLSLTWKDMDDASGYMVFYKEESEAEFKPAVEGSGTYQPADQSDAEVEKSGSGRITTNSYTLTGLGDGKLYEIYVIGWNELGWGSKREDRIVSERTETSVFPQLPKYHAINLFEAEDGSTVGKLTPHIVSADCSQYDANPNNNSVENDRKKAPRMVDSELDGCRSEYTDNTPNKTRSALGVVDNDYDSYWQKYDWDEGYVYGGYGIRVRLDQAYRMSYLTYSAYNIEHEFAGGYVERTKIRYRNTKADGESAEEKEVLAYVSRKYDPNGQMYYLIKFQEAVEADEIRMCLGRGYGDFWMRVGEIRFHECDDWYDGIMGLFADEMHSSLKPEVTAERIEELKAGLETTDHGEKHPLYDSLKLELDLAEKLFADREKEQTVLKVDTRLTTNSDGHLKFGGLNAWQPLGRVAAAGETMVIYVGHNIKRAGESSNVQAVFTQYHAQSNELNSTVNLKIGRNEILVPKLTNENRERGGQVYIQYTGARGSEEQYEVRALGGHKIPALNIYKMAPGAEKTKAIEDYVRDLDSYVKTIQETHQKLRPVKAEGEAAANEAWKSNIDKDYTDRNCLLNATDLMMDYMMYSVPALQVWKGITLGADVSKSLSGAEVTEAAQRLETSLNAMEDTMKLFYQHKGLTDDPEAVKNEVHGKNEMPVKHLNIRYMQMFAGAFMYASGNHIGVEYPETNIAGGAASWDSFGWGIGHEIGHDINQSWYAIAEITNNYFAQLITKPLNGTRFKYEIAPGGEDDPANDIYSKVTSGTVGRSANGAVQLGLYWQLHLAFDNKTINNQGKNHTLNDTAAKVNGGGYTHTDDRYVFDSYEEQFANLFFARVDTYGRNPEKAPKGKVPLTAGAVDQNLMRLACAAADANILPFFRRWGMEPDKETETYAKLYGEETAKALYYVNDDARDYRAAHPEEDGKVLNQDVIETAKAEEDGSRVSITVTPKADVDSGALLGYEIIRGMYSNGKLKEDVVGFKLAEGNGETAYIDEIATVNNRVMYYKVRAVDKYLNYSKIKDAGCVKIQTNGALAKGEWTVGTTMTSDDDVAINPNPAAPDAAEPPAAYVDNGKDDPDGGFDSDLKQVKNKAKRVEHSVDRIIDGSESTAYTGKDGSNASVTIDMHDFYEVTSLLYRGDDLGEVTVSVSEDNADWTDVKKINMTEITANEDGSRTIWFDAVVESERTHWIGTYRARYVKLAFSRKGEVKIQEIDICGPSGDNLEFEQAAGESQEAGRFVIGVLNENYRYSNGADKQAGTEDDGIIPEGSLVFTGRYKGNPAYNVVLLYDEEGNLIGSHTEKDGTVKVDAEQIIFAEVPAHGELGETSDGIWVYYLKKEIWENETALKEAVKGGKIRGELYRVDNALTNEGERIVSDTKFAELPETLPKITMTQGSASERADQN